MKLIKLALVSALVCAANGAYAQYPADAELMNGLGAGESRKFAEPSDAVWGVGKRETPKPHDPFPFGGGPVDD
jgi:hypothetical protein